MSTSPRRNTPKMGADQKVPRDLPMPAYDYFVADFGSAVTVQTSAPLSDEKGEGKDVKEGYLQNVCLKF